MTALPKHIRTTPQIADRIFKAQEVARSDKPKEFRLWLSNLGRCQRDLWLSLQEGKPGEAFDGRMLSLFDLGDRIEKQVIEQLQAAHYKVQPWDPENGQQWRVTLLDGEVSGRLDSKILIDGNWIPLEIKSCSEKKFAELAGELKWHRDDEGNMQSERVGKTPGYEAWNEVYKAQIHLAMLALPATDAQVIVVNKNTSEIYAERIGLNINYASSLTDKARAILAAETIIDRPPEAKSQGCKFCNWCPRKDACWGPLDGGGVRFDDRADRARDPRSIGRGAKASRTSTRRDGAPSGEVTRMKSITSDVVRMGNCCKGRGRGAARPIYRCASCNRECCAGCSAWSGKRVCGRCVK